MMPIIQPNFASIKYFLQIPITKLKTKFINAIKITNKSKRDSFGWENKVKAYAISLKLYKKDAYQ